MFVVVVRSLRVGKFEATGHFTLLGNLKTFNVHRMFSYFRDELTEDFANQDDK